MQILPSIWGRGTQDPVAFYSEEARFNWITRIPQQKINI